MLRPMRLLRRLLPLLCLLWAGMGGGANASSNVNQRYNFDRLPTGSLTGWSNVGSANLTNQAVDAVSGQRGFGAAGPLGTTALWTGGGTHQYINATFSTVVHRDGGGHGSLPTFVCNSSADNTTRYDILTPYWDGTGTWRIYVFRSLNGSDAVGINVACADQTFADGSVADVSVVEDNGGIHIKCWNATSLQPGSTQDYVDGSPLPAGYAGLTIFGHQGVVGTAAGLAQDLHIWDYPNAYYGAVIDGTVPSGQAVKLVLPPAYNANVPCPLILWFHGDGATVTEIISEPSFYGPAYAAGYAILDCNAQGSNWGNPASQQDYVDAYTWAKTHASLGDLYFAGGSMGGLNMFLALVNGKGLPTPKAVYSLYSVCNRQAALNSGTWAGEFAAAYSGISADGCDPALYPPSSFPDIPCVFVRLAADTTVPTAQNTDVMLDLLADKRQVKIIPCRGTHGDPSTVTGDIMAYEFGRSASTAGPTAAQFVAALEADSQWKDIHAYIAGSFTYNTSTHVELIYDYVSGAAVGAPQIGLMLTQVSGVTTARTRTQ
jgi:hypothetical protein